LYASASDERVCHGAGISFGGYFNSAVYADGPSLLDRTADATGGLVAAVIDRHRATVMLEAR